MRRRPRRPKAPMILFALLALALAGWAPAADLAPPRPQDAPWALGAPQGEPPAPAPPGAFKGVRGRAVLGEAGEAGGQAERPARDSGAEQGAPLATPAGMDLLDRGEFAAAAGRFDEAERLWRQALAQRPDWGAAKARLAELPARKARFRPELEEQQGRREARLALVQGVSDFNDLRYSEAAANFERYLKVFPGDAQARHYLELARARGLATGRGRLHVYCAPQAQVVLDGRPVGQTPLSMPAATGPRRVEVRAHGGSQTQEVRVPAGGEAQVSFTLLGGFLAVNAQPWAEVLLDGKPAGQTPVVLENLVLGPHTVSARHTGYQEQSQTVVLTAGQTISVQFTLEPR